MAVLSDSDVLMTECPVEVLHDIRWDGSHWKIENATRTYEWLCDKAGGETTHEATYGVGGFELVYYNRRLTRKSPTGVWVETYKKFGAWVEVV